MRIQKFLCVCVLVASGHSAFAHDGVHDAALAMRVAAKVTTAIQTGKTVVVQLDLYALDVPVQLDQIAVRGAQAVAWKPSDKVIPRVMTRHAVTLLFDDAVPGIFTLTLDFGDAGQGPVVVMPNHQRKD